MKVKGKRKVLRPGKPGLRMTGRLRGENALGRFSGAGGVGVLRLGRRLAPASLRMTVGKSSLTGYQWSQELGGAGAGGLCVAHGGEDDAADVGGVAAVQSAGGERGRATSGRR